MASKIKWISVILASKEQAVRDKLESVFTPTKMGVAAKYIAFDYDPKVMPHVYALEIDGDSMEPEYFDGEIIIVNPDDHPRSGVCVCLVDCQGEDRVAYIKDVHTNNGKTELRSLNRKYPPIEISTSDCEIRLHRIIDHVNCKR